MIRNIGFIMFMFAGCAAENPNDYNGGTIWYSPDDELPQAQPVCMEQEEPVEWDAHACVDYPDEVCCIWLENDIQSQPVVECQYDWCYDKWECEWQHVLSRCESVE